MYTNAALHKATHALATLISAALLSNQNGFDRILPMYCVFLACTPFVLKQFTKGRAWLVGAISATLWISAQFGVGDPKLADPSTQGNFNFMAWQAFFIAGQYFGYRALRSPDGAVKRSRVLMTACVSFALLLMLDRHMGLWGMKPILHFSGHPDHNPARFLDAACLAYLIWLVPRSVDLALMKLRLFQFLNFLGGHSLQVFAFSMLITRFEAHTIAGFSPALKMIVTVLTILSLAIPAWLHKSFRERSRPIGAVATADAPVPVQ
jgi:hypothetical protein